MGKNSFDCNSVEWVCCKKIYKEFYRKMGLNSYDMLIAGYIEIISNKHIFEENLNRFNNDYTLFCFRFASNGMRKYLDNENKNKLLSLNTKVYDGKELCFYVPDLSFDIDTNLNLGIIKNAFKKCFLGCNKNERKIIKDYYKCYNLNELLKKYHTKSVYHIVEKFKEDFIKCLIDCGYYDNSYLSKYMEKREDLKSRKRLSDKMSKENIKRKENDFLACEDIPLINKLIYKNNLNNDCIKILNIDLKLFNKKMMCKKFAHFWLYEISMLRDKLFLNYSIKELSSFCGV